ncbi:MAG: hypothetical protein ACOCW2_02915, partial [Chitinivibrionales bacterium]
MEKNTVYLTCLAMCLIAGALVLSGCSDLLPTAVPDTDTLAVPMDLEFQTPSSDAARIGFRGNNTEDDFAGYVIYEIFGSNEPLDSILFNTSFTGDTAFYVEYDPDTTQIWGIAAFDTAGDLSEIQTISSDNQVSFLGLALNLVENGARVDAGLDIDWASFGVVDVQNMDRFSGFEDGSDADLVFTAGDSVVYPWAVNGAALVYLGQNNDSTTFTMTQCDSIQLLADTRGTAVFLGKYRMAASGEPLVLKQDTVSARQGDWYALVSAQTDE